MGEIHQNPPCNWRHPPQTSRAVNMKHHILFTMVPLTSGFINTGVGIGLYYRRNHSHKLSDGFVPSNIELFQFGDCRNEASCYHQNWTRRDLFMLLPECLLLSSYPSLADEVTHAPINDEHNECVNGGLVSGD
jgi:hypothetical protein